MPKYLSVILSVFFGVLPAHAAEFGTVTEVLLSPDSARITAEQNVKITANPDGQAEARFLLPKNSFDVSITAEGRAVEDWSSAKSFSEIPEDRHERREALRKDLIVLEGQMQAAKARMALWSAADTKEAAFDETVRRDEHMQKIIPELHAGMKEMEERIKTVKAELDALPAVSREVVAVRAALSGKAEGSAALRCIYTTPLCGWLPSYRITALPDLERVTAQLYAEIRRDDGQDWNKAHVMLLSRGDSGQAPRALPPWRAGGEYEPAAPDQAAGGAGLYRQARAVRRQLEQKSAAQTLPAPAPPLFSDGNAFASWDLGARTVREGRSRLLIRQAQWKTPVFRLARPALDSRVFFAARFAVEDARAWPQGQASYFLDNAAAGNGLFLLRGGRAEVFFGVDPRVTVFRELDSRQSGTRGIIVGKRRSWDWKWTFKAFNAGSKPVLLRVEDAEPQAGDKDISVTLASKPEAKKDGEHVLYWEIAVPANEGVDIDHAVTISAPADMKVQPGR